MHIQAQHKNFQRTEKALKASGCKRKNSIEIKASNRVIKCESRSNAFPCFSNQEFVTVINLKAKRTARLHRPSFSASFSLDTILINSDPTGPSKIFVKSTVFGTKKGNNR